MSGQSDGPLGLYAGSVIRVNGNSGGAPLPLASYTVTGTSTYQDMVDWLNSAGLGLSFSILATGALEVTNGTGAVVEGLSLTSSGAPNFADNFQFESSIAAGASSNTGWNGEDGALRGYAAADDAIVDLYSYDGLPIDLDLASGSAILELEGMVGEDAVSSQLVVDGASTVADLIQELQFLHGISTTPVAINEEGQIVVTGEVGTANALGDIQISELGVENQNIDDVFAFNQTQQARDRRDFTVATTIYDSLGGEHIINFRFQKIAGENTWVWEAETDGLETITSGGTGQVTFSEDGVITSFTYDGGVSSMTIQPQPDGETRAEDISVTIDYGTIGELTGLTQFEGSTTLQSQADGYTAGSLVDFAIDQNGVITGQFSNDTLRDIARVALADFSNPAGLVREANNTYRTSGNSGDAMSFFAGEGNGVTMVPGALETSNVDLAMEFTRLVVAQRSFQANSRVITTGDQVMQELVNLIR
jgi:flagellar hook-basal body protein